MYQKTEMVVLDISCTGFYSECTLSIDSLMLLLALLLSYLSRFFTSSFLPYSFHTASIAYLAQLLL
jgi:hypothetical protein